MLITQVIKSVSLERLGCIKSQVLLGVKKVVHMTDVYDEV